LAEGGRLKDVDIVNQANPLAIARFGGFLLKSSLQAIGNIMQDSGLLEVIQSIYPGSTKTSHILDGGYFDDSLKLFNRLIIFTQGDMTVGPALEYELTPIPLSLFDTATQIRR
jgi:hypothetical protein